MDFLIKKVNLFFMLVFFISGCSTSPNRDVRPSTTNNSNISQVNKIYFAGFALSGDEISSKNNFPYTSKILQKKNADGRSDIDAEANKALKTVHNPHLEIITDSLGDYKLNDQAISAAVVLDSEDVSQESIGGKIKVVITLRGQIVAFNFKEMKVVGSYPLTAELIDSADKKLNDQEIEEDVKRLFIGEKESFIKVLVGRFNRLSINSGYTRGIQIKNVSIGSDITKLIGKSGQNIKDLQTFVARNFEKYLTINQNVSVLPFAKDQSVGGRLSARFSNGDVYHLEIPSPDFTISLDLKKLIKKRVAGNDVEDVFGYASIMNIKAEQPEMAKTYIDVDVRYALAVTVPKTMTNQDQAHYIESTIQLSNTFTKQLSNPESEWLDTWVESKNNLNEQFEQFLGVVNKCK